MEEIDPHEEPVAEPGLVDHKQVIRALAEHQRFRLRAMKVAAPERIDSSFCKTAKPGPIAVGSKRPDAPPQPEYDEQLPDTG